MKSLITIVSVIFISSTCIAQNKSDFFNNIGIQVQKSIKSTTFSGIDFEEEYAKGKQGFGIEVNKHFYKKAEMGYRHSSIGMGYRSVGIAINEGNYAGTKMDMGIVEVPFKGGFTLYCPPCGFFFMIPVGVQLGGSVGVPISATASIVDKSRPDISPYAYYNKYEKPMAVFSGQVALTLTVPLGKAGNIKALWGLNSGITGLFRNADNVSLPYETNTQLGYQFIGIEYISGSIDKYAD